ncbi:MAG: chorismate mutase [Bacteroidales bacterium]
MGTDIKLEKIESLFSMEGKPLIIGGPCSAESEFQILQTAKALDACNQVKVFRAGLWKPRTRPNGFEGVGAKGLPWMQRVRKETSLLTAVEVAKPSHVEKVLKHDIDIIWLGARTTTNPFSVQEIAESLRGVDIPVMIKNPLHADLKLWVGAMERLNSVGVEKLIAIHRGFYAHHKTPFRNPPLWEIPIELRRIIPDLPILVDPSHICGNTALIPYLSQKALDLEMNGLMIEAHFDPDNALSDAFQQLRPDEFKKMIDDLVIRKFNGVSLNDSALNALRDEIDRLDDQLIQILAQRLEIVEEIGRYKKEKNLTILQLERWNKVISERVKSGEALGLNKDFMEQILRIIHEESIQKQNVIMNTSRKDTGE